MHDRAVWYDYISCDDRKMSYLVYYALLFISALLNKFHDWIAQMTQLVCSPEASLALLLTAG